MKIKIEHPKFKYRVFSDATKDMRVDFAVGGMTPYQLQKKYSPLIEKRYDNKAFKVFLYRAGFTFNRTKRLKRVRERDPNMDPKEFLDKHVDVSPKQFTARLIGKNLALQKKLTDKVIDRIIDLEVKYADQHFHRMHKIVERVGDEIGHEMKTTKVGKLRLGSFISNAEGLDKIARRTYRMDERDPVTPHQFNLTVLTNLQGVPGQVGGSTPRPPDSNPVLEAEVLPESQSLPTPEETEALLLAE